MLTWYQLGILTQAMIDNALTTNVANELENWAMSEIMYDLEGKSGYNDFQAGQDDYNQL